MTKIFILNGSVYGKAMEVADTVEEDLQNSGFDVEVRESLMADEVLESDVLLVITSTTGSGEVPANILPSFLDWKDKLPQMQQAPAGIIALGDSGYDDTFCAAGEQFEELLQEMDANLVCEMLRLDAGELESYDSETLNWLEEFKQKI